MRRLVGTVEVTLKSGTVRKFDIREGDSPQVRKRGQRQSQVGLASEGIYSLGPTGAEGSEGIGSDDQAGTETQPVDVWLLGNGRVLSRRVR